MKAVLQTIKSDYLVFESRDFIKNPVAFMRMKAKMTQTELAKRLNASQAYISKVENDDYSSLENLLNKVKKVLEGYI